MTSSTSSRGISRINLRFAGVALAAGIAAAVPVLSASAQAPGTTVSSFTAEQAARGRTAFATNCATCHGSTLGGEGEAPALIGPAIRMSWFNGTADGFFIRISTTMPQQAPGSLDAETYADIMAFILDRNRIPAGDTPLPADVDALAKITLPPPAA